VIAIAAGGDQTCALTMAGAVKCWGNNRFGQIGNNTNTNTTNPNPIPADVIGLTGVTAISAGSDSHTCALTVAGGIKCWGWNYFGELGTSTNVTTSNPNPAPVDVSGLGSGMSGITAGGDQTCALTVTGGVQCWGQNKYGQLGNIENSGNVSPNPTPIDVTGFSSGVAAVSAGNEHTCELTNGGGVLCSGNNFFGQLGNVINNLTSNPNPSPLEVTNLASGVDAIAVGSYHSCALTTAGGIKCWGENNLGQLGKSANSGTTNANPSPADVTGLTSGVTAVAAAVGGNHTCALTTGGGVKCWGDNYYGQVGNSTNTGTTNPNATPTDVTGLTSGVSAIASGGHHSCAVTTAGTVKCWGANNEGQLGNTTNVLTSNPNSTPLDVNNLSGVVAIAVGLYHSCALTTTGGVKCWGDNAYGQLGNGTNSGIDTANPTATAVTGLSSGVVAIAAGVYHTCAVTTQGGVKCWGDNDGGQLGSSTNADTTNPNPVPTDVAGLTSGAAALTAGLSHTCALTTQGGLECWGTNSKGQFGTGSTSTSPATTPSTVLAGQSIAFTPSLRAGVGNSVILHAAVSSGLSPFFDIWTPDTCAISAISNDMLVLTQPGICGVRASRAVLSEEGEIADAPQQLRLLHVEADLIFSSSFQSYGGFNE
jgi:alpha-tubulin suppressor-like RCC1 family protein